PMMLAAKKCGVPVRILHSHNTKLSTSIKKERITKLLLPLLKREITDYCACGQLAGEALFGKAKFTVIPNVISPEANTFDKVKRDKIRKELGVDDKVVVGTVGRTSIQKNPYFAIDVIEKVHQSNPSIVYWWIGSGELDDQLRAYVEKKGLVKVVSFLGSRDDVQDLYQAMDVFFLPSLFEGLPLTGVEAQAMGLPSILSASVTDELVYTDLVKYVSLDEPIEEWEKAFKKAIERIPQRRAYTEELKQSVYSAEDAGKNMAKIYEDLLASKLR
ncbi:glycosyltransferase, partial [Lactiplantibacillus argentoratensis]|uniref:glycosyltransferase n=1 Tax=Lactiplantibacillus argentoratensis TaxID=271881 RepID=UPI00398ACCCB